jgi:hypothetical protein
LSRLYLDIGGHQDLDPAGLPHIVARTQQADEPIPTLHGKDSRGLEPGDGDIRLIPVLVSRDRYPTEVVGHNGSIGASV